MTAGSHNSYRNSKLQERLRKRQDNVPIPALANRFYWIAKKALPIQPPLSALLCLLENNCLKAECDCCCTVCWSLYSLSLCSRSPHMPSMYLWHYRSLFPRLHPLFHLGVEPGNGTISCPFAILCMVIIRGHTHA